ncbi:hypothetical protein [Planctomicrobium piriforme]|uniref:hypothetical protein n=1 Tax=Planctomicrobium piriforme TaxID=1576369 RepID=UPI001113EB7E|nr:hypothetical protein [Planctomicrobium piriforme]
MAGEVTLDGNPLLKGLITFSPVEPGPSANGKIRDGKIVDVRTAGTSAGAVPGEHRVTIFDDDLESGAVDHIPDRYGRLDSPLSARVSATGQNEFQFQLESKPLKK